MHEGLYWRKRYLVVVVGEHRQLEREFENDVRQSVEWEHLTWRVQLAYWETAPRQLRHPGQRWEVPEGEPLLRKAKQEEEERLLERTPSTPSLPDLV